MNQTKRTSTNKRNNNLGTALSPLKNPLGQRAVQTGNAPHSWASAIFSQSFFLNAVNRCLSMRTLSNLRLVCVDICKAIFEHTLFPLGMSVERLRELNLHYLPRLYPTFSASTPPHFKQLRADAIIETVAELHRILADSRFIIKKVIFKGELEALAEVLQALPLYPIEQLEIEDLPQGAIVDFSSCKSIKDITLQNELEGTLVLPSSLISLELGGMGTGASLGLNQCLKLKTLKLGNIQSSNLQLSPAITTLETGNIAKEVTLDLTKCKELTFVKLGNVEGNVFLPESIEQLEAGKVTTESLPNVHEQEKLSSIKLGEVQGKLLFPEGIQILELGDSVNETLDLSAYEQLKSVKIGNVSNILLPEEIVSFEGKTLGGATTTLDWRIYRSLQSVKIGKVHNIIFPKQIKVIELGEIGEANNNFDWRSLKELTSVRIEKVQGTFLLPKGVGLEQAALHSSSLLPTQPADPSKAFVGEDIKEGTILDLSKDTHLESVKVGNVRGILKLPTTLTSFECRYVNDSLDLTQCTKLTSMIVDGMYNGSLKLPLTKTLKNLQYGKIEINTLLDLSYYTKLTTLTLGTIAGILKLPPSLTHFEAGKIEPTAILDLRGNKYLKFAKVNAIEGTLILPATKSDMVVECEYIGGRENYRFDYMFKRDGELDASRCTRLTSLKLGKIKGPLMLPRTSTFTSVIVDTLEGVLILPPSITSFKCRGSNNSHADLSRCINIQSFSINMKSLPDKLILPASLRNSPLFSKLINHPNVEWK